MTATTPPAVLVRLGEADVVRLCGLAAAAAGLDLVARHAVARGVREGGRLRAVVEEDDGAREVWVEPSETPQVGTSWHCDCPAAIAAADADITGGLSRPNEPYALGCAHVAAVLSAWIRSPAEFASPHAPGEPSNVSAPAPGSSERLRSLPPIAEHVSQPQLLRPPGRPRGAMTIADELMRLPAADLSALARRVLRADLRDAEARVALDAALRSPAVLDALLARLDAGSRALLAQVLLLGGAITAADLDGIAARSTRPANALYAEMTTLARFGLVFAAPGHTPHAPTASADPSGAPDRESARSWRQISGWRVPTDLRPLLRIALPIPAASTSADGDGNDDMRSLAPDGHPLRVIHASPRSLLLALALLPHAPGPLNPFAIRTASPSISATVASFRPRAADDAAPVERPPLGTRAPFPLVPGDLPPSQLAALARGLGVASGLAQLARRLLLWAREGGAGFGLHDLARLPAAELPLALRAAFALWRGADLPAELADLDLPGSPIRANYDATHAALRPASLAAEVAGARDFTLRLLAACGEGIWYRASDLLDLVWRTAPLFLRGRQGAYTTPAWWLRTAEDPRPLRPSQRAEWEAGEGRYLSGLLAGPPHWLGALDLAYAPDGRLLAVRVTTLGAFLLGLRETPGKDEKLHHRGNGGERDQRAEESNRGGRGGRGGEREEDGAAGAVGAVARDALPESAAAEDMERVAESAREKEWGIPMLPARDGALAVRPLAAGAELLDAIEVWARPEAVADGRLIYRLAADHACAALDAGAAPDALLARLDRLDARHGTRVAAGVRARLETWRAAYGASRIESGWTLLEARDAALLAEALAASPEIAARCRRIAPASALVPDADAPRLRAALARRGFQV